MSSYLDRLNLRPNERRLVVAVAVVVFIVLNIWMVWPHFGDLRRARLRLERARQTLEMFRREIQNLPEYQSRVASFEKENPTIEQDEQSTEMLRIIDSKAAQNGVNITTRSRLTTTTNQFFIEQTANISVQAEEEKLVNFLYDLGVGDSAIRVRGLSLQPDAQRQQLSGQIKLVASYQRKLPSLPAAAAPSTGAKPAPAGAAAASAATTAAKAPGAVTGPASTSAKPTGRPAAVSAAPVRPQPTSAPPVRPLPPPPSPATPSATTEKKP